MSPQRVTEIPKTERTVQINTTIQKIRVCTIFFIEKLIFLFRTQIKLIKSDHKYIQNATKK